MKIGIIAASGKAGRLILKEAVERGHDVTAIVRDKSKIEDKSVKILEKDVFDLTTEDLKQFDVVVNAFGTPMGNTDEDIHVNVGRVLINALKGTGTRLIVVGGAGSLYLDDTHTKRVIETLPDVVIATAKGQMRNLEDLEKTTDLSWTFVSPSLSFVPEGKRTGRYRTGKDQVLYNTNGKSYVSYADFAIAILDEIEKPEHINQRFTVVSEEE
jgi:putative NADH-flavin reductase